MSWLCLKPSLCFIAHKDTTTKQGGSLETFREGGGLKNHPVDAELPAQTWFTLRCPIKLYKISSTHIPMTFRSNMALNITLLSFSTNTISQEHLIHIKAPLMFTFYFSCFTFPRYYCRLKLKTLLKRIEQLETIHFWGSCEGLWLTSFPGITIEKGTPILFSIDILSVLVTFAIRVILRCWGNSSMVCQQNSDAL